MTSDLTQQNIILINTRNDVIEEAISDAVRKHLFTADSSSSCQEDDMTSLSHDRNDTTVTSLLPSLTHDRNSGPKRRKPSRQHRRYICLILLDDNLMQLLWSKSKLLMQNFASVPQPNEN